jgi:hypothetical protein
VLDPRGGEPRHEPLERAHPGAALVTLGEALYSAIKTAATIAARGRCHSVTSEPPAAARLILRTGAIDSARRFDQICWSPAFPICSTGS